MNAQDQTLSFRLISFVLFSLPVVLFHEYLRSKATTGYECEIIGSTRIGPSKNKKSKA